MAVPVGRRIRTALLLGLAALAGVALGRRRAQAPSRTTATREAITWPDEEPDVDFDAAPAIVRLVNLFLHPREASALPFSVQFPWGDPFELDARAGGPDTETPIATALAYLETEKFEDALIRDVAWMTALLAFITRSPVYADALVTRGGPAGGRWERIRTNIGLPKYGRRKGSPLFRTPAELAQVFNAGWVRRDVPDFEDDVVPIAVEWHNFARQGRGQHFVEFRLIHQWIALELLAAHWAKGVRRTTLLNPRQMSLARDCLEQLAEREQLDELTRRGLMDKAAELGRTPMRTLVIAYLTEILGPYPAQPFGEALDGTVGQMIKARNDIAHKGSLVLHESRERWNTTLIGMDRLEGITARAILAEMGAPISLLTDVPWTDHRSPA
jgi:hypothetical protein